ncbi:lipopolysaccharide biosynthesis protein [Vibrio sp. 1F263]|uniref:lipopolysaccharide biosynthesis protein n=1 Tax=Vibrio sp. 1F263 TaxID=3230012 RepID=UPI00352D2B05
MNDKLKPKLVFVGYKQQYEKLEIDVLSSDYEKHHIFLSKWLVKLVSFLFFYSKKHYHEAYGAIIRRKIKALNGFDVIFTTDSLRDIKSISKIDGRKVIVFRNVTDGSLNHHLNDFEKYTFDEGDAAKYDFKHIYLPMPQLKIIDEIEKSSDFDVSFVGVDKGRKEKVQKIKGALDGFKCNFIVFDKKPSYSYVEYLTVMLNTKCVLEIVLDGQTSDTMRVKEALYARKKIITNHAILYKHHLYSKDNFLIFDSLNELASNIESFISSDFDESVFIKLEDYTVDSFYHKLLSGNGE